MCAQQQRCIQELEALMVVIRSLMRSKLDLIASKLDSSLFFALKYCGTIEYTFEINCIIIKRKIKTLNLQD